MEFDLTYALLILSQTPAVLARLLSRLPPEWTAAHDGADTWSVYDVVGHLIHGERTDWIPRARRILEHGPSVAFESFDRTAQFRESQGKSLLELLAEFERLRAGNLEALQSMRLDAADMDRRGLHPELGEVTLGQLLATWVVHDLNHIGQIVEVMSRQYRQAVGPWRAYLSILA